MHNPATDSLVRKSFPELADALRKRTASILQRFQDIVRQTLPSADELTFHELNNSLPKALEDMAVLMASAENRSARKLLKDSIDHGACRYHQSFNLGELLIEYSVLRALVIEEIAAEMGRPLEVKEIASINGGIDAASNRAVICFVEHQSKQIGTAADGQSKYLSFLSHDLRGSLNGILLMTEVLRRELEPMEQFRESVQDIALMRRSILETVSTMDRFLHAEKFRHGKVEVKLGEVNLEMLIPIIVSQFNPQAREKGVAIHIDVARCPRITSDRELISLILQNLVNNAIKYSSGGTVKIISEIDAKDGHPRVSVADEGFGIAPEKLSGIFTPFTRGDTHGEKGIGLGLSIALQAADLLKGRLRSESVVEKGSTFILELPHSAKLSG